MKEASSKKDEDVSVENIIPSVDEPKKIKTNFCIVKLFSDYFNWLKLFDSPT